MYASMGNYVFRTRTLFEAVSPDAQNPDTKHDLGGNIIPMMVERGEANVYDFRDNEVSRAVPTGTAVTGAMWGRSTRSTTPTWT